jgi:hypothetical protein
MLVCRETLAITAPILAKAQLLGLDVEWKPFHSFSKAGEKKGITDSPASTLQVSNIFPRQYLTTLRQALAKIAL